MVWKTEQISNLEPIDIQNVLYKKGKIHSGIATNGKKIKVLNVSSLKGFVPCVQNVAPTPLQN
jgi:hypothetical protein